MGSSMSSSFLDTSWESLTEGEWRSARAKELDKLGGMQRIPVKRGHSMDYRLEWLTEQVHEQGDKIIAALDKSPPKPLPSNDNKAPTQATPKSHRIATSDWMNLPHSALRVLSNEKQRQELGSQGDSSTLDGSTAYARVRMEQRIKAQQEAFKQKMTAYYTYHRLKQDQQVTVRSPRMLKAPKPSEDAYPEWRKRVMAAKRKAFLIIRTVVKFRKSIGSKARLRQLRRMGSYSIFFAGALGDDHDAFVEELTTYRRVAGDIKQLKGELRESALKLEEPEEEQEELRRSSSGSVALVPTFRRSSSVPHAHLALTSPPVSPLPSPSYPRSPRLSTTGSVSSTATSPGLRKIIPRKGSLERWDASGMPRAASSSEPTSPLYGKQNGSMDLSPRTSILASQPLGGMRSSRFDALRSSASPRAFPRVSDGFSMDDAFSQPDSISSTVSVGSIKQRRNSRGTPSLSTDNALGRALSGPLSGMSGSTQDDDERDRQLAMETVNKTTIQIAREEQLLAVLREEMKALERPARLLGMFANRCNAQWVERGARWDVPSVVEPSRVMSTSQMELFQADAMDILREGKLALQVFAAQDYVDMPGGDSVSMWSSDPWELIAKSKSRKAEHEGRLVNLEMGLRQILSAVAAMGVLVDKEAVKNLIVVLHINEEQEEKVCKALRASKFCSLPAENIVLVVERRYPGYTYDPVEQHFVNSFATQARSYGTGISLMQCSWPEEAFTLLPDWHPGKEGTAEGELRPGTCTLKESVFEHLTKRGVKWVSARSLRDLSQYAQLSVFDVDILAAMLFLRESQGNALLVQGEYVADNESAQMMDGVILSRHMDNASGGTKRIGAVDVKYTDLKSPKMVQVVDSIRKKLKGKLLISSKRYFYHLDTMKELLISPSVFHPSLVVSNGVVYLNFDLSDLTALPQFRSCALLSKLPMRVLASSKDVEELAVVVARQDASPSFRHLASSFQTVYSPATPVIARSMSLNGLTSFTNTVAGTPARPLKSHGQRVVLFASDNAATVTALQCALALLRPGRDQLVLVTVSLGILEEHGARALLRRLEGVARASLMDVKTEILSRSSSGTLVEQLLAYVDSAGADLVVMGSQALSNLQSNVSTACSVTLAVAKNIQIPMVVVKATWSGATIRWDKEGLRVLVPVDHGTRDLLRYVCTKMLQASRKDELFLARGSALEHNSTEETHLSRRLLDNFADIASSFHFTARKKALQGTFEDASARLVEAEKLHVLALRLGSRQTALKHCVLTLLSRTRSAMLLYRHAEGNAHSP